MACLLLQLALSVPTRTIAGLTCNIETMTVLQNADVSTEQSEGTACATLESLVHGANSCDNNISLVAGGKHTVAYRLYNETHADNLLTLASFSMSECVCPVLDFGCKDRCANVNALRVINSDRRSSIIDLHKSRSAKASQIREEYAYLITAATKLLNRACSANEDECDLVETLSRKALT